MALLSKAQLMGARKGLKVVELNFPELGGEVRVAEPTAEGKFEIAGALEGVEKPSKDDLKKHMALVFSLTLVTENNQPMFSQEEALTWLKELPNHVSEKVFEAGVEISGLIKKKDAPSGNSEPSTSAA